MAYVQIGKTGKVKSKRSKKRKKATGRRLYGTVYLIRIDLDDGRVIHKVGYSTRVLLNRVLENAAALQGMLGFIPRMEVVAEVKTRYYSEVERWILDKFVSGRCEFERVFNGSSEYFDTDGEVLIAAYDEIRGNELDYIVPTSEVVVEQVVEVNDMVSDDCEMVSMDDELDGMSNDVEPVMMVD